MEVTLRRATEDDCLFLFQWRDEVAIANSAQPKSTTMEEHEAWFKTRLKDKSNTIFIGMVEGRPFGVIRFDECIDGAEVSINVDPYLRGHGLGRKLLKDGIGEYKACTLFPPCTLFATIRGSNVASLIIFLAAGFELVEYNRNTGLAYLRREPK